MTDLSKKLNFYRFLTIKLTDDDLYPHYNHGEPLSLKEIKTYWRKTVKAVLKKKAPQKLGLYIHIPFCRQKCNFCFCDSYVPSSYSEVEAYLNLLIKEMDAFKEIIEPVPLTSIYFGGGSPSYLKVKDIDKLFKYVYRNFKMASRNQIIFEGTPTDLNKEILSLLADNGVNRLTIGIQSLDPKVIKLMGRPQTKEKFLSIYKTARELGISCINIDLIAGLEGQSIPSFISDLKMVLRLRADMVHVTGFKPLAHTRFAKSGKILSLEQQRNRDIMITESQKVLKGFSRDVELEDQGCLSSEEAANFQETDIRKENSSLLGIGYSAQSHAFGQVWYMHPHSYNKSRYNRIPVFVGVRGSLDEEMRKFIFNNLQRGFSRKFFYQLFRKDVLSVFRYEILELIKLGKLKLENDQIISYIKSRREFLILSKLFYSKERIQAIFSRYKDEYDEGRDYQKELDVLCPDYVD